ncbi:hypothetical protein [Crassaminicella profunda]|uniref:hypothetical protein n=1 Tax=Crassaminicella profunda TaxID=1286698 RepID=UPI001CA7733D|nr:hypothetical protein [Crassaminicella profunda]QZY55793.1 hypothetical protein K7H06_01895 [Crassaminicella profunda]
MPYIIFFIFSIIPILIGMMIITGKKIMVSRTFEQFIIFFIIFSSSTIKGNYHIAYHDVYFVIIAPFLVAIISFLFLKGKYSIYNTHSVDITPLISESLEESHIDYILKENAIIIPQYNNRRIDLNNDSNCTRIDLSELREIHVHKKILIKIKSKLGSINKKYFPTYGVFFVVLGILWIGLLCYGKIYVPTLQNYLIFHTNEINHVNLLIDNHKNQKIHKITISDKDNILKYINELNKYPLKRKYIRETLYNLEYSITYKGKNLPSEYASFFFEEKDRYIDIGLFYCKYLSITITDKKNLDSIHYEFELLDKVFDMKPILLLQRDKCTNRK